ncbi:hypothetical protein M3G50_08110 [Brachybacterium muris]|uniref:hypothetical protein n=1 Tax=Brachybacterium muris TaxID=219301 RepID=UPI0021A83057|nr:hypothetical protein [Brachybacterium muris]MCT1430714.1 hypothetical protein [Brachybacterium muris]
MSLPFRWIPAFKDDLAALPKDVQKAAIETMFSLARGEQRGAPLFDPPAIGDLSDCRKVYLDPDPDHATRPRYRLVYRERHGGLHGMMIEAIAAGERYDMDVYARAAANLGRTSR